MSNRPVASEQREIKRLARSQTAPMRSGATRSNHRCDAGGSRSLSHSGRGASRPQQHCRRKGGAPLQRRRPCQAGGPHPCAGQPRTHDEEVRPKLIALALAAWPKLRFQLLPKYGLGSTRTVLGPIEPWWKQLRSLALKDPRFDLAHEGVRWWILRARMPPPPRVSLYRFTPNRRAVRKPIKAIRMSSHLIVRSPFEM